MNKLFASLSIVVALSSCGQSPTTTSESTVNADRAMSGFAGYMAKNDRGCIFVAKQTLDNVIELRLENDAEDKFHVISLPKSLLPLKVGHQVVAARSPRETDINFNGSKLTVHQRFTSGAEELIGTSFILYTNAYLTNVTYANGWAWWNVSGENPWWARWTATVANAVPLKNLKCRKLRRT